MNKRLLLGLALSTQLLFSLCGCGGGGGTDNAGRHPVFAGIAPLGWLAGRVGGERVSVAVLVEPGQNAHAFEPTPRQVALLARSRLYFLGGLPFEAALAERVRRSMPGLELVDLRRGLTLLPLEEPGHHHEGSSGEEPEQHHHEAGEPDPHFWLDPVRMSQAAEIIQAALCRVQPQDSAYFRANLARTQADLAALDRHLESLLAPYRGRTFFVFHPAFGYFAARYGLVQAAVEAGGQEPSARELARLTDRLRAERAGTVFVQRQFALSAAASLQRALGVRLESLDPQPADYPAGLDELGRKLAAAFAAEAGMN